MSNIKQVNVSDLTAKALGCLTEFMSEPAQCLGSPSGYLEVKCIALDGEVTHKAGLWTGWQGLYWLVELRTGIISYHGSALDARERVKLDRQVATMAYEAR